MISVLSFNLYQLARVGLCIDLGTCNLIGSVDSKTGICHQKKCSSDKILVSGPSLCNFLF